MLSYADLRLNQIRMKATHNSYQRDEALTDQLLFWRVRSIELDVHTSSDRKHDWKIYHNIGTETAITWLSDALPLLLGFTNANRKHELVIVAIDLKNAFDADHTPDDLDALLWTHLGPGVLVTSDMVPLTADGKPEWPLLSAVRGRFLFILTTGDLDDPDSHLNQYLKGSTYQRCFVAPEIADTDRLDHSKYTTYARAKFYNVDLREDYAEGVGQAALAAGWMCRGYGANDEETWKTGLASNVHIIGTDLCNFIEDPWARTDNANGFPYQALAGGLDPNLSEQGAFQRITVTSGNLGDHKDSCLFHVFPQGVYEGASYCYAVGVPSSHAPDKWGKVGLMARASTDPDAANVAVVRTADNSAVVVQCRPSKGADTHAITLDPSTSAIPGARGDTWIHLRLDLSNGGRTVTTYASYDALTWTKLLEKTLDVAMTTVGVVASSHTHATVQYLVIPRDLFTGDGTDTLIGGAQGSLAAGVPIPDARW